MNNPEENPDDPLNPEEQAVVKELGYLKRTYLVRLPESFSTPLAKSCDRQIGKIIRNAEEMPFQRPKLIVDPRLKADRKMPEDEKELLRKFRKWMSNPTHPDVLRWLTDAMVVWEIKSRTYRYRSSQQ